jgi:hypothetical protein
VYAVFPVSPSNSSQSFENRRRLLSVVGFGVSVSLLVTLILFVFMRSPVSGVPLLFFAAMLVGALVLAPVVVLSGRKPVEKRKRNLDAYALIDRLVEELDDDEIAYLRRRLDARESALPDDVAVSIEDLLDTRADTHKR